MFENEFLIVNTRDLDHETEWCSKYNLKDRETLNNILDPQEDDNATVHRNAEKLH